MGCRCFKGETLENQQSLNKQNSFNNSMKDKYKSLIQSETTYIRKKLSSDLMMSDSYQPSNNNQNEIKTSLQWLAYLLEELKSLQNEYQWAKPLFKYVKAIFGNKADTQQMTLKFLAAFFWNQLKTENSVKQSPDFNSSKSKILLESRIRPSPGDELKMRLLFQQAPLSATKNNHQSQQIDTYKIQPLLTDAKASQGSKLKSFRDILSNETGQDALNASEQFNMKVLLIKKQLEQHDHPLRIIIDHFDKLFFQYYSKEIEKGISNVNDVSKEFMPKIVIEVQNWVRIVFFTVLKFYRIELKPQDVKKDLLINMVTSLIMQDQSYSIIMNSILQANAERVKNIQKNMNKYKFKVNLEKLGVSKYFHFSTSFKDLISNEKKDKEQGSTNNITSNRSFTFSKKIKRSSFKENMSKPFEKTIEALKEIPDINAPMSKLEYIYQVFNTLMVSEIDEFWSKVNVDPKKLEVDYENLNGIAIYVALKTAIPILIVDILFIENFVSKAIMSTNRAYQMTVLHSAMQFIEENLPSYYDAKDKKSPLKEHFTPQFVNESVLMMSPRSVGNFSNGISKFADNSFNRLSGSGMHKDQPNYFIHEELLFLIEHKDPNILNIERTAKKTEKRERNNSEDDKNSSSRHNSSIYNNQFEFPTQGNDQSINQDTSALGTNNRCKSNIQLDAAKTIHKLLNNKLHKQSMIGNQRQDSSNVTDQNATINQSGRMNIYNDNEKMLSSFNNSLPKENGKLTESEVFMFKNMNRDENDMYQMDTNKSERRTMKARHLSLNKSFDQL